MYDMKNLTKLKLLVLGNATDASLVYLKGLKLELLNLNGTQVTDVGLTELSRMRQLRRLRVFNPSADPKGSRLHARLFFELTTKAAAGSS